jgi:HEAT repeat protein
MHVLGSQLLPQGGYAPSAAGLVKQITDKLLNNPATLWADAKATLLNERLSDTVRAAVLWRMGEYKGSSSQLGRSAVDDEIVAAAARLGATSADPDVREAIWAVLRNVDDPQLIQPLLKALASDADATVRMQAAFTLRTFLKEPGVREALLRAAAEDPDSVPAAACCLYTVREAAERAAVPDQDFREWVRARLYDESLPTHSRLRPLAPSTMDGRILFLRNVEFGAEAAREVFDLGRHAQDPQVRVQAWEILYGAAPDDSFVPELLSDLTGHPDEHVRASAAKLLFRHEGNPDVRKALDNALEDPSMQVRIAASGSQKPFRE